MLAFTMDSSLTDFLDAKEQDVHKSEAELKQVKEDELMLQRHKQQLQAIRASLEIVCKQKNEEVQGCRQGLSQIQKNIFDQIYPIVEDIYHQELLVLELTEQLQLTQISKDVGFICSKISEESRSLIDNPSDPLWCWYKEMKEYEKWFKANNRFSICEDNIPDCHFFYASFKEVSSSGKVQLSFSTRYKYTCLHITISRDSELSPEGSGMPYQVTTDFTVDSLELNANKCLLKGTTAHHFVDDFVWPFITDLT
ncbi:hypothetical protein HOLleu_07826 [Holothuria leucospilota]|uniref:Uncharacterized protein n=1 Tax=Holothuria leucospilota TaxID=206669 RepID=A0A9Q1CGJ9_HOLLE|nr:hypothetical protein HOLleu_07826 [Holothuria leucospilota]